MLRFDWDSLRVGDGVLVHGASDDGLTLERGRVVMVDTKVRAPNGVGILIGTGDAWHVVWPMYLTVHPDPRREVEPCQRCDVIATQAPLRTSA